MDRTRTDGCDRGCGEDLSEHSRAEPAYRPGIIRRDAGDPGGDGHN